MPPRAIFTGTPTKKGTYTFDLLATDSLGEIVMRGFTINIT